MFRPADVAWLADCWDAWESGVPAHAGSPILLTGEAWRLSHGFIGCNLVIDLVEEQRYLEAMGSLGPFSPDYAPGLTCDELADWLQAPHQPRGAAPVVLVGPGAEPFVRHSASCPPRFPQWDPWAGINLWLLRECLVRHLTPAATRPGRTGGHAAARQLFEGSHTVPQPATIPTANHQRGAAVLNRFDEWWDQATGRLVRHLDGGGWHSGWDARTLSRILCPTPHGVMCQCPLTRLSLANVHAWLLVLGSFPLAGPVRLAYAEDVFARRDPRPFVDWVQEAGRYGF